MFLDILVDTGAGKGRSVGHTHHLWYCSVTALKFDVEFSRGARFHFSPKVTVFEEVTPTYVSSGEIWHLLEAHILDAVVSTLLFIDNMDRLVCS